MLSFQRPFTSILMEVKSQEEFVRRLTALPKHARDVHEWEGGRCDYHPLRVCTCNKCPTEEIKSEGKLLQVCTCNKCPIKEIKCEGKPYQTRLKLDCEFHALLYEIECMGRASQASRLVHPVLKRGHSNLVEASHNVLIRFRSKDISLERLHYHLSTNIGLLQANLTYVHGKRGTSYHWIPELYRRMKLPDRDESRGSRLISLQKYGQFSSPLSHCRGIQWSVSTLLFTGCSDHLVLCH